MLRTIHARVARTDSGVSISRDAGAGGLATRVEDAMPAEGPFMDGDPGKVHSAEGGGSGFSMAPGMDSTTCCFSLSTYSSLLLPG